MHSTRSFAGLCQLESSTSHEHEILRRGADDILFSATVLSPTFVALDYYPILPADRSLNIKTFKISLCKPDARVLPEPNSHCPNPLLELLLPNRINTYDYILGPLDSGKTYTVCISVSETHNLTISRPTNEAVCERVLLPGILSALIIIARCKPLCVWLRICRGDVSFFSLCSL